MPLNQEESLDPDYISEIKPASNAHSSSQGNPNTPSSYQASANSHGIDYEHVYGMEERYDANRPPSVSSKAKSNARSKKSAVSGLSSSTHSSDANGSGKEISDVGVRKIAYMRNMIISFGLHGIYLALITLFNQSTGLILPFNPHDFRHAISPIMFGLAIVCFFMNEMAMRDAFAAGAGYLLSRPEGYSIAVCGFNHSSTFEKILFPWQFGKNGKSSKVKWILVAFSCVWAIHALIFPLAFISSTGMSTQKSRIDSHTSLMCLVYSQKDTQDRLRLKDRQIPTLIHEMGVAELIDGTALGLMRSSDPTLTNSTHYFPPQLTDSCQDGSTIIGNGFKTDILSNCYCSSNSLQSDFTDAGFLSNDGLAIASNISSYTLEYPTMINYVSYEQKIVTLSTVLAGTGKTICPADNSVPICTTKISNHQVASLLVSYKTDGTPASIATHKVSLVSVIEDADMINLYMALQNQLSTTVSMQSLKPTFSGGVNPFLWMMTNNSRTVSSDLNNLIAPGMEYITALILRSAMQRSYVVTGGFCQENKEDQTTITVHIDSWAYSAGFIWVAIQFLILICFFFMYIPWLRTEVPIYPGIQIAQDSLLFAFISCKNVIPNRKLTSFNSYADPQTVWPKMDVVLRIGESVLSAEDPERGVIVLDKPKMVTAMSYQKTYV